MTPEVGASSLRTRWTALRRPLAAMFVAGSVAVAASTLGSSPAAAADPVIDVPAATSYLTSQLVDGNHLESEGFGPDVGLTIDGGLALAASGSNDAALIAIEEYVEANVASYAGIGAPWGIGGGQVGKSALFAQSLGLDPRAFGGQDLIALLASVTCTGPDPASDVNCPEAGSYYNVYSVISQALGVIAQLRAGETAAAALPLAYLLSLQNPDGGFPSNPAGGASDVGSTAYAAMALALSSDSAAATALTDALAWIATQQLSSGGFPGDAGDSINSAGLAIQALTLDATTYAAQIDGTQAFLLTQQNVDGGFFRVNSAASQALGSDARATAQAVTGALAVSFGVLLYVPVPPAPSEPAPAAPAPVAPAPADPAPADPALADSGVLPAAASAAAPVAVTTDPTPQLAATGSTPAPLSVWAVALLLGGAGMVLLSRAPARAATYRGRRRA